MKVSSNLREMSKTLVEATPMLNSLAIQKIKLSISCVNENPTPGLLSTLLL